MDTINFANLQPQISPQIFTQKGVNLPGFGGSICTGFYTKKVNAETQKIKAEQELIEKETESKLSEFESRISNASDLERKALENEHLKVQLTKEKLEVLSKLSDLAIKGILVVDDIRIDINEILYLLKNGDAIEAPKIEINKITYRNLCRTKSMFSCRAKARHATYSYHWHSF